MTELNFKQRMFAAKKANDPMAVTLQNILEKAQKIAKTGNREVTEADIVAAAKKENKELLETLEFPMADEKKAQLIQAVALTKEFLPQMATEAQITSFVQENTEKFPNIGAMMRALKEAFGGTLDGAMASRIVKAQMAVQKS